MPRVHLTPSARLDLLEIWDFIAHDNLGAADQVLKRIRSEFQKLAEVPGLGHERKEIGPDYRVWAVYSYLIVYRPDVKPIQIMRVVHGHRDLKRLKVD